MSELSVVLQKLKKKNVFLTGGAGVGKSYLTKEIIEYYKDEGKNVITLGSTGIAAVNVGGYTIHSFLGFGICSDFNELKKFDRKIRRKLKEVYGILKKCDLLVIDEISMVSANLLEMILYRLRESKFRGRVLLVGDFFQLPPVIKKRDENTLFDEFVYAFESSAWGFLNLLTVELMVPKRAKDYEFVKILKKIRIGECDEEVTEFLQNILIKNNFKDLDATVLFGTNREADAYNEANLARLKTPLHILKAQMEVFDEKLNNQKLQTWIRNLPVDVELKLKIDSKVLFRANKRESFYNGERGRVVAVEGDFVVVEKDNGSYVNVERNDYKLSMIYYDENEDDLIEEVLAVFSQYPLKSAYGITIHKSQGMSIDKLICNVNNIFEKSQFYVAISRATDPKSLNVVYNRGNFESYLKKIISVNESVRDFYRKSKILKLKEYQTKSLFEGI